MKTRGFTILELIVSIVIVVVLAFFAIPAYQNHIVQSRVMEGVKLATEAQKAVHQSVAAKGVLPETQDETNYISPAATEHVASISIATDSPGRITITFKASAGGGTIIMEPIVGEVQKVSWTCTGGTLLTQFRPKNCQ